MKSLSKYAALILSLLLIVQPVTVIFAEDSNPVSSKEFKILSALGFADSATGNKNADDFMTRGEFAHILAKLRGMNAGGTVSYDFIDVRSDNPYADGIYYLKGLGIIKGINSYQFSPDGEIKYIDAVKTLVLALGYEVWAEERYGGYPGGYLTTAANLHIVSGSHQSEDSLTVEDALSMLYKAAVTDIMKPTGFGESQEYKVYTDNTMLAEYCDIYYGKNLFTDNGYTSIKGASAAGENYIIIGEDKINKNGLDYDDLIGCYVEYFFKETDNGDMLLYAGALEGHNTVTTISFDDLNVESSNFTTTNVVYTKEDGKDYNLKINPMADMIYNGKAYPEFTVSDMKIKSGELILVDNNNDGTYELIKVSEYDNIYVSSVDYSLQVIYDKYGKKLELSKYDSVKYQSANGAPSALENIKEKQIVSYYETKDKELVTLKISGVTIKGAVSEIINDSDSDKYVVNGIGYELASSYKKAVADKKFQAVLPELNSSYTLYLDFRGFVAGLESEISQEKQYAYLIAAVMGKTLGTNDTARLKLFMPNGQIFETYTDDKITIDGVSGKAPQDFINDARLRSDDGSFKRQLITVTLNTLGDVKEIEFAKEPNEYGYNTEEFSCDYSAKNKLYKGNNVRAFGGKYILSPNTLVMFVPPESDFDVEDLEIISTSRLTDGGYYDVTLYDVDAALTADVAIVSAAGGTGSYEQNIFVVDEVSIVLNKNGEQVRSITGCAYGAKVTYNEKKAGVLPADIKKGDAGRVSLSNGEISAFSLLARLSGAPQPFISGALLNSEVSFQLGYVYSKSDAAVTVVNPDSLVDTYGKIYAHSFNGGGVKVTVYNRSTGLVRPGTLSDIVVTQSPDQDGKITFGDGSTMLLIYRRYDYAREIVVIRD